MSTLTGEMTRKEAEQGPSNLWSNWRDGFVRLFKTAEHLGNEASKQREALQGAPVESKWEAMFSRVAVNTDDKSNSFNKE